MAGEYLRWKYRDVKPEAPRVLTAAERRANWWDYHKWHVLIGAVLLLALADLGNQVSGIGRVEPDCQFALVCARLLPDEAAAAFESAAGDLCGDLNGDGRTLVRLNRYAGSADSEDPEEAMYAYASGVRLTADLEGCDSVFFLLEDPKGFQRNYEALSGGAVLWTDCPVLCALPLGTCEIPGQTADIQTLFSGLYLGRRDVPPDWPEERAAAYDALWEALTEGAAE